MAFTQIPQFPLRSEQNQDTFSSQVEAVFTAFPDFIDELNALGSILNAAITSTSTTSLSVSTGDKTLTVQTGLGFVEGYPIRIAYRTGPTIYMDGVVKTYNPTTGALVATIALVQGSGTFATWAVMILPAAGNFASLGGNKFTGQQVLPDEVSIASASTLNFTAGGSNQYLVNGTTTVTAVTMPNGAVIKARFSGIATITHGANLQLPGAVNYTTAAGDILTFTSNGTIVRVEISRASGIGITFADVFNSTNDPEFESTSSTSPTSPQWVKGYTQTILSNFSNMQVFTTSGNFTVPSGVTKVKATVVGGGGAGGGTQINTSGAGGGGAGGTSIGYFTVTPLSTIAVTVGSGGSGVAQATGNSGGSSSFGSLSSATGGAGGGAYSAPSGGVGGVGIGGSINFNGQGGGASITGGASAPFYPGAGGGNSFYGGGAMALEGGNNTNGAAGTLYGGGGGGASGGNSSRAGGAGAAGVVIVEY